MHTPHAHTQRENETWATPDSSGGTNSSSVQARATKETSRVDTDNNNNNNRGGGGESHREKARQVNGVEAGGRAGGPTLYRYLYLPPPPPLHLAASRQSETNAGAGAGALSLKYFISRLDISVCGEHDMISYSTHI